MISHQKRRVGRGIGSSKGKTSGRGHKGQKARAGGSIPHGFEGGQTKLYKLLPKRGFNNKRHAEPMVAINVGTIQDFIDMGRLNLSEASRESINEDQSTGGETKENAKLRTLTLKDLVEAGICTKSSIKYGVKLLAKGKERLKTPFNLHISRASESAIQAIENIGGQVTTVHYNKLALRTLLSPEKFVILPKQARPPPKWQAYYTNWDKNRGYLSVQAQMRNLLQESRPDLEESFTKALEEHQKQAPSSVEDDTKGNQTKG